MSERNEGPRGKKPEEGPGADPSGPEESPPPEKEGGVRPGHRSEDLGEEGHVPEGDEGRSPPDTGTYTDGGSRKKSR